MVSSLLGVMSLYTYSAPAQVGIMTAFSLLVALDLVGNTLVVLVVLRSRPRTVMNYLLLNLALADMLVAIFIGPRFIFSHLFEHPTGQTGHLVCKFVTGSIFSWIGAFASVFTLIVIAFERYFSVLYPQSPWRINKKKLLVLIGICWLLAVCWNIPYFLLVEYHQEINFCMESFPSMDTPKVLSLMNLFAYGVIPVFTMAFLYGRVVLALRVRTRRGSAQTVASRKRVTQLMLTISVIYCVCWLPNAIILPITVFGQHQLYSAIHTTTIVLVTLNSAINPLVYTFQSNKFRTKLKELLACCCSRNHRANEVMPGEANTNIYELTEMNSEIAGDWDEEEGDVL